ncbi:MAG TPA: hypothetical protein DCX53_06615 [Anaerolineae bacterium]|nr:hypothetical protein [Anaerolineae bacterium]
MMRTALSTTLSAEGMFVLAEIADNRDALRTASDLTPDLILFSVNDVGLNDFERISALRQSLPNALIIVLVTGEIRSHFQSALEYGAHLVLTKSTPRSELLNALKKMLVKKIDPVTMQVN